MEWVILVLIAAFFVAMDTLMVKKEMKGNKAIPVLFLVSVLSSIFVLLFWKQFEFGFDLKIFSLLIFKAFVLSGSYICLFLAYKKLVVSVASPLMNLSPIFLIIFSFFFLNEILTKTQLLGVGLLLFSGYALELHSKHSLLEPIKIFRKKEFLYIFLALIGLSFSAILDKILLKEMNYPTLLFDVYILMSLIYFIFLIFMKEFKDFKKTFKKSWLLIVLITIFSIFADISYLMAIAMPEVNVSLAIPLKRSSTLITTIVGGRLFKEKRLIYKSFICILMLIGFYLIVS